MYSVQLNWVCYVRCSAELGVMYSIKLNWMCYVQCSAELDVLCTVFS